MPSSILDLILNTRKTGTGAKDAKKELDGVTTSLKSLAAGAGLALGAGGAAFMLGKFLSESVAQAAQAQQAHAQLTNAIAGLGAGAGVTAKSVEDLSLSLSRMSTYDDEAIVSVETIALRAGVAANQLPKFTQAVLDLAAATGESLPAAATVMVAAYDEPVAAINRLERSGLRLPAALEAQVAALAKAGDQAGATALLMEHLASVTGGAAAAAADTYTGKITQLKNEWQNLQEAVGEGNIGLIESTGIIEWATKTIIDATDAIERENFLREHGISVIRQTTEGHYRLANGTRLTNQQLDEYIARQERLDSEADPRREAIESYREGLAGVGEAAEVAAPKVGTLMEAMAAGKGAFVPINFSLPDPAAEFTKIDEYLKSVASGEAAGGKLTMMVDLALQQGQLDPGAAADIQKQIGVTSADLAFKAGEIDAGELQTQLTEVYGMPAEEAKAHIKDVMTTTTDEIKDQMDKLGVKLATEIQSANPAIKKAMQPIFDAAAAFKGIKDKEITITVVWVNEGRGLGGQHGLDIMVPEQVKGDNFPVFATGGERVIVQTPAQQAAGVTVGGPAPNGGGGVTIREINVNNGMDERALLAMLRRLSG
ncbi:MAG TPA: hypothetical protein VJK02_13640 [Anaerolineales bacterium]|nr:hypothetical protein [Anaerolineales bacterium]